MTMLESHATGTSASLPEWLGATLPILQAPMAGVQDAGLAQAVSTAGGLGAIPCALLTPKAVSEVLEQWHQAGSLPCNLNFFCHQQPPANDEIAQQWRSLLAPYFAELGVPLDAPPSGAVRRPFDDQMLATLAPFKPPLVSFHFGLPAPELVQTLKSWGTRILSSATTVAEARWLAEHGADAVIAQGIEAGGHRGMFLSTDLSTQMGTMALLPQIVKAVDVPVIAAGGISSRAAVRAAQALGASAVQVGTAYLLCPEARTSPLHRASLTSPAAEHTGLTNLFSGRPARSIVNRAMRELGALRHDVPPFPYAADAIGLLRQAAEARGTVDFTPLWCGQNASDCRTAPAADITRHLAGLE